MLEITNPSTENVQLRFRTRRVFDFAVRDGSDSLLWMWSRNRLFGDTITLIDFEPGTTETVRVEWDQRRSDGGRELVGRGMFRGWGILPVETGDLQSRAVSFRID